MGLFKLLFGAKKKPHAKTDQAHRRSVLQPNVSYVGDFIEIKSIGFVGQFKKSKSGEWIVCWSDSDKEHHRGGHRESGYGHYVLFNAALNKIVLQGKLERPNSGSVSNNGYFSIEDWHFGSNLSGTFYAFSPVGEELVKKKFNANIFNSDISNNGRFAICQTANNPKNDDGNLLVAFDLTKKVELFSVHPTTGWADSYDFFEDDAHFAVVIDKIGKFQYDVQGNFIDSAKYDSARLNCKKFEIILFAAEEILKEPRIDHKRVQTALEAVLRARSLGADNDKSWKALALKIQGTAHELMGNSKDALGFFEEALKINPKIGVKRKAGALRKKLQSGGS